MSKLIFKLEFDNATNKVFCSKANTKDMAFGITVDSTADLTPNATEFFSKALLEGGSRNNFRLIPNVKDSVKVASYEFGTVLQPFGCDFNGSASVLSSKTMSVFSLMVNAEICQSDLETSFLAEWMRAGSNIADFTPAAFMSHVSSRLAAKINDELEVLTWQSASGVTGLVGALSGSYSSNTVSVQLSAVTVASANVVAEMTKVYNAIPQVLKNRLKDLVWYVSSDVANAYRLAVATVSAEMYTLQDVTLSFLGIKIITAEGLPSSSMYLSLKDNFVYLTDLLSDENKLTIVNMLNTTGEFKTRIVSALKFGVSFTNGKEIVSYNIANNI